MRPKPAALAQPHERPRRRLPHHVGTEDQAKDLLTFIKQEAETEHGIWETNIFGKSVEELVMDGIRSKIAMIGDESQTKLQDTMQKIVNDSNGGLVCIII